jgi:hypothetical protein
MILSTAFTVFLGYRRTQIGRIAIEGAIPSRNAMVAGGKGVVSDLRHRIHPCLETMPLSKAIPVITTSSTTGSPKEWDSVFLPSRNILEYLHRSKPTRMKASDHSRITCEHSLYIILRVWETKSLRMHLSSEGCSRYLSARRNRAEEPILAPTYESASTVLSSTLTCSFAELATVEACQIP